MSMKVAYVAICLLLPVAWGAAVASMFRWARRRQKHSDPPGGKRSIEYEI
ncbi:MAG: hypothetical protein KDA75_21870 [Planctomycetaceae bacterium]|nr:hypothetical protein [Planctomycetaceae bacterium]